MKINITISFIALFIIACSKENNFKTQANDQSDIAAAGATAIPLNDLGAGTFKGYTGGLYPGGLNYPTGTYADDLLATCRKIEPIDTFGNPSENGRILFVSIGWSTGSQNLRTLKNKTTGNPLTDPKLFILSLSEGAGQARLNNVLNPKDRYWDTVTAQINDSNVSYRQVQIIYLETEDSTENVSFPGRPQQVRDEIEGCCRVFKQKFPNVKLVYLLGRTTTFGDQRVFNTEPCPYYFGWACKWAIEDQINGVAGTAYKGKHAVSPMIAWGFYQWATGKPRTTDGFRWVQNLTGDGLHANPIGKDTLATRFQNFLLSDKYAKKWYTTK